MTLQASEPLTVAIMSCGKPVLGAHATSLTQSLCAFSDRISMDQPPFSPQLQMRACERGPVSLRVAALSCFCHAAAHLVVASAGDEASLSRPKRRPADGVYSERRVRELFRFPVIADGFVRVMREHADLFIHRAMSFRRPLRSNHITSKSASYLPIRTGAGKHKSKLVRRERDAVHAAFSATHLPLASAGLLSVDAHGSVVRAAREHAKLRVRPSNLPHGPLVA
eukprot:scaffold336_cov250-Pinguiococcus_pyrenoidosus.AAC.23